jgi:hypothetical protein
MESAALPARLDDLDRGTISTLPADDRPPCSRLATALVSVKVAPSGLAAVAESDVTQAA